MEQENDRDTREQMMQVMGENVWTLKVCDDGDMLATTTSGRCAVLRRWVQETPRYGARFFRVSCFSAPGIMVGEMDFGRKDDARFVALLWVSCAVFATPFADGSMVVEDRSK